MTGQFTWLDTGAQVEAGRALFSSDLTFQVWAYTVSHRQLLLRAWREGDGGGTRTDVLFRGVAALRIRSQLPELVLHQATPDERRCILAEAGVSGGSLRVIVLHARPGTVAGYVAAHEVGWLEDTEDKRAPSALAAAVPLGPDPLLPADARTCQPAEPERQWLASLAECEPGAELFRSDRTFSLWSYTVSHGQLALRSHPVDGEPRIDVLIKPVGAVKTGLRYDGLVLRRATLLEQQRIVAVTGPTMAPVVILGSLREPAGAPEPDFVMAHALGWVQDGGSFLDASTLARFVPATDPNWILPSRIPRDTHWREQRDDHSTAACWRSTG